MKDWQADAIRKINREAAAARRAVISTPDNNYEGARVYLHMSLYKRTSDGGEFSANMGSPFAA